MTSTGFTVGLDGTRVSSKVLKPPGGGSSDIFGLGATRSTQGSNGQSKEQDNSNTQSRLFGSAPVSSNVSTPARNASNIFHRENQSSVSKKQYVRRNPITGEGIEYPDNEKTENSEKENEDSTEDNNDEKTEVPVKSDTPAKVIQTSIRVRNPPGGKSSGIF